MKIFASMIRRTAMILPLLLLGLFLEGCTTLNESACRTSPLLITDLMKVSHERQVLLPDGTTCPSGMK